MNLIIEVENYEEDCGRACTPNGCSGHDTGIPERITINGFTLILEDFAHGDWPFLDPEMERIAQTKENDGRP